MSKFHLPFVFATLVLVTLVAGSGNTQTYKIEPTHASVAFRIRHLDISWTYGRFDDVSGTLVMDPKNPSNSSLSVVIKAASINTGNSKRDAHLRSPDFLNVKQFPAITFKSKSFKRTKEGYDVIGNFSLHGVTREITLSLKGGKTAEFPKGVHRIGFSSELSLLRKDFGMTNLLGPVGNEVQVGISFEGAYKE